MYPIFSLPFCFLFFNYSLHSILLYSFRCTAQWLDNHILWLQVFSWYFQYLPGPSIVITILLTTYSLCCILHPCENFANAYLYFLIPSSFSLKLHLSLANNSIHIFFWFVCLFILFFKFHTSVKSYGICVSLAYATWHDAL